MLLISMEKGRSNWIYDYDDDDDDDNDDDNDDDEEMN